MKSTWLRMGVVVTVVFLTASLSAEAQWRGKVPWKPPPSYPKSFGHGSGSLRDFGHVPSPPVPPSPASIKAGIQETIKVHPRAALSSLLTEGQSLSHADRKGLAGDILDKLSVQVRQTKAPDAGLLRDLKQARKSLDPDLGSDVTQRFVQLESILQRRVDRQCLESARRLAEQKDWPGLRVFAHQDNPEVSPKVKGLLRNIVQQEKHVQHLEEGLQALEAGDYHKAANYLEKVDWKQFPRSKDAVDSALRDVRRLASAETTPGVGVPASPGEGTGSSVTAVPLPESNPKEGVRVAGPGLAGEFLPVGKSESQQRVQASVRQARAEVEEQSTQFRSQLDSLWQELDLDKPDDENSSYFWSILLGSIGLGLVVFGVAKRRRLRPWMSGAWKVLNTPLGQSTKDIPGPPSYPATSDERIVTHYVEARSPHGYHKQKLKPDEKILISCPCGHQFLLEPDMLRHLVHCPVCKQECLFSRGFPAPAGGRYIEAKRPATKKGKKPKFPAPADGRYIETLAKSLSLSQADGRSGKRIQ